MTERYNTLQTLAFRLAPKYLPHSAWALAVPEEWKEALVRLQAQRGNRDWGRTTIPSRGLHKALRALVPGLIAIEARAWQAGPRPWLYSTTPVDAEALIPVVHAWAQTEFATAAAPGSVGQILRASDLIWEAEEVDLAAQKLLSNGTAEPGFPSAFHLLPDLLARKLCEASIVFEAGDEPLRFRRAPLPTTPLAALGGRGAELISWPPRRVATRRGEAAFSVVLSLTVQTVPFQAFPVVHCDISIRRWAYAGDTFLPKGEDTSVYLQTSVPWLADAEQRSAFQVAPMRWKHIPEAERTGSRRACAAWSHKDNFAAILERLQPHRLFPDAEAIRAEPQDWLRPNGSQSAAITFRNGMTPEHELGVGLGPGDRRKLALQIAQVLQPEAVLSEPLQRAARVSWKTPSNPFPTEPDAEKAADKAREFARERRLALSQSFKGDITFEIRYQQQAEREALRRALRLKLGMAGDEEFPFSPGDGCTFHLREEPLNALAAPLEVPGGGQATRAQVSKAIEKRCEEVASQVLPASHPTLSLIQILPRDSFEPKNDPKGALRRAFARTGRLTQFLATDKKGDAELLGHRARSAVLDALRQLGLQLCPPRRPKAGQGPIHAVGLWILKSQAGSTATGVEENIPVMVRVDGASGEVLAIAGLMEAWRPYREVLLLIGSGQVRGVKYLKDVSPLIQKLVRRDLLSGQDVLLTAHAQNARLAWPWLQNGKLSPDFLAFNTEAGQPIADWRGLRIVRVRDEDSHETPEYYPATESESPGFAQGLFCLSPRVFMSLNPKPKTVKLDKHRSILESRPGKGDTVYGPSIGDYNHNNALCEITMACIQPGDDPKTWADFAHRLRVASTHHDGGTALPLPLHLAMKMGEYVLPLEFEDEE